MSYHYLNYAATVTTMADNGDLIIGYKVLIGKVNMFCQCHVHMSNQQYCQHNIVILYLTQSTSHCKVTFMDLPVFCSAEGVLQTVES